MEMQNVKNQVKSVFTPARLKKAAALAVLVGIVSAGGAYYHHSQAEARSAAEKQARSEMLAAQAEQRGIVLLDEAKVRSIAAEAIGKTESELDFRAVYLTAKDHDKDEKHDKKHRDDRHGGKHDDREHRDGRDTHDRDEHSGMMPPPPAAPAQADAVAAQPAPVADGAANVPAAPPANGMQQNAPQPMFHPVYKVKCCAGNVEYKLCIDAVTGTVLKSKAEIDDDIF